jgi:site-specific DNA-methyltransferase (adenine-specific)
VIRVDLRVGRLPEALADFEAGTFHAALTDPPYGLGQLGTGRLRAMLNAWLDGREATQTAGMLGRAWDVVVGPPTWAEIRRVCRPGALIFAYSHSRTAHYQTLAMELGGWRILPQWQRIHGGAMALGQDVSKAIDKAVGAEREVVGTRLADDIRGGNSCKQEDGERRKMLYEYTAPATPLAARFEGYSTATRNVVEPIVSAVNPPAGSWAGNAEAHGCGGFNVGDSRIPSGPDHAAKCASVIGLESGRTALERGGMTKARGDSYDPRGRYPSNVLLEHAEGCGADWCVGGCPVRTLGEMSGELAVSQGSRGGSVVRRAYGESDEGPVRQVGHGDSGTAARFYYQGRASREERHRGAEGLLWRRAPNHPDGWELVDAETWRELPEAERFEGNPHLAVKAADGGSHLASLLRQPDDGDTPPRLLVPYAGTGSEVIAAMLAGWRHIVAVEMSPQWAEVARRRIAWWQEKIEAGSRGEALAILRHWGTGQIPLFGGAP